jgi:hypothetical protein
VVSADEPIVARLGAERGAITYGTSAGADYRIEALAVQQGAQRFELWHHAERLGEVTLPLRGVHMARNAAGAAAMALTLGAPFAAAQEALARFGGVARRFDFRGEQRGITLVDDYAHLPAEIAEGEGYERLKEVAHRGLKGLKVAPFYGCQILRPSKIMGFEDPDRPWSLERIIEACGGEAIDYPAKIKCCGFPIIQAREDVALAELI